MSLLDTSQFIWATGREKEKNLSLLFLTMIGEGEYDIQLTASTLYRLFVNSKLISYGPARAPHGFARVDQINLSEYLTRRENIISIEITGHNIESFYMPKSCSFLRAEIRDKDKHVIKYTGLNGDFDCYNLPYRIPSGERITAVQRHFTEKYDYSFFKDVQKCYVRRVQAKLHVEAVSVQYLDCKLLPRITPMPDLNKIFNGKLIQKGYVRKKKYAEQSLEGNANSGLLQKYEWGLSESDNQYLLYEFEKNYTGFIKMDIECLEDAEIVMSYDEILLEKIFSGKRTPWINNFITLKLTKGQKVKFESFEVYTLKYLAVFTLKGNIRISHATLREYAFPLKLITKPHLSKNTDSGLRKIYEAAVENFRQNTVDVFMDCPGRERAAWLCDSYFTARASYFLTGSTIVEEVFIENFLLPDKFENLPLGMIPMCYPADTDHFIPQWPMWLLLQIDEYINKRNGTRDFPNEFKKKILAFIRYFDEFINEYGLLESISGWNFIEWSKANDYVEGVHFPTNMLYAKCLEIVSKWYGIKEFAEKAKMIKKYILNHTFDGEYFVDNALRKNNKLKLTDNHSEICQYFAFYFSIVDISDNRWKKLFNALVSGLTSETADSPSPINMFIGRIIKLELLLNYGYADQVLRECSENFSKMVDNTGTLWEEDTPDCSCCHGFASYVSELISLSLNLTRNGNSLSSASVLKNK